MADTQSARTIAYSRAPFSTWLGVVFLFALFGLIVLAVIGPSPRGNDYEQTRAQKRMERLKTLREETSKDLTTYAWVDKGKGIARIPIDRAMELTVAELAQKKPAPAGPIATPAAQTPPTAASPASPAGPKGATGSAASSAAAGSPLPTAGQSQPAPASPAPATTP